jgi:hypothetical protein
MPPHNFTDTQLQELVELARGWGKIVARRSWGAEGPDRTRTFTTMEDVAGRLGQALLQGILEALLEQPNQQLPHPELRGRLTEMISAE